MSKKKYRTKKENIEQVNESKALYGNKKESSPITISTLKEQEESNYIYWLSLTPEERWAEHYKLLQKVYGIRKNNKSSVTRIIFDT